MSYTPVTSAFVPQTDFDIFLRSFFTFCLFLMQKDFDIFHVLLFRVFLCVFNNIYLPFFILRKNYKKYLINFLCEYFMNCFEQLNSYFFIHILYLTFFIKNFFITIFFIRIFFTRVFSIKTRRNLYVVSNILRHLFFFSNIFTLF